MLRRGCASDLAWHEAAPSPLVILRSAAVVSSASELSSPVGLQCLSPLLAADAEVNYAAIDKLEELDDVTNVEHNMA